jgi:hypothetical protein
MTRGTWGINWHDNAMNLSSIAAMPWFVMEGWIQQYNPMDIFYWYCINAAVMHAEKNLAYYAQQCNKSV